MSEVLDSVLEQTYQDWECIIINDGSTDNLETLANQYCQNDSIFHYIYQEIRKFVQLEVSLHVVVLWGILV